MATKEPYGLTPLTTEGLANLGHPLSLSDFNQDAQGRYWRTIRGEKTYYPREWFDAAGTFTGTGTQPGDQAGQDSGFFHRGTQWDWTTGQWHNPINWANVIGVAAAGGVGAGFAAPLIAGAVGGGAGAGGVGLGETAATTGLAGSGFGTGAGLGITAAPGLGSVGGVLGETAATVPGVASGAGASSAYGPLAGGYGAATPSAAVPSALAGTGGGGMSVSQILAGMGGSGAGAGPYSWIPQVAGMGLNYLGQQQQLGANQDALGQQLASTKYASDAQSQASANQLAFLRQQATYDAASAEANRSGNYDQWAAKQRQLGTVGQALGLPARDIPAYVPLPAYGGGTTPAAAPGTGPAATVAPGVVGPGPGPSATSGGLPQIDPSKPIGPQAAAYIQSRGGTPNPSSADYWQSKWPELVARGQQLGDPLYAQKRLAAADELGGGGAAPAAAAPPRYQPLTTVAQYFADPSAGIGKLPMPTVAPYGGAVGTYF
jgi:hypothetical protein